MVERVKQHKQVIKIPSIEYRLQNHNTNIRAIKKFHIKMLARACP